MRIFLTGGSGFVGSHLIERLAAEHELLAMARSSSSAERVHVHGARPVRCSLEDVEAHHMEGIDAVIHAAAFVEEWGSREQFWRGNVEGTQRMLDAARGARAQRFVHIGTEAVLFDGRDLVDVDESHPYPERQRFLYSESKAEAERRVLAAHGPALHTVVLRPRLVWGPRDNSVLPAVERMVEDGGWVWLDGGRHRTSTAYVGNVAEAVALALHRGRGGQAYFISDGQEHSLRDVLSALARTRGLELPDRSVPGWLARGATRVVEAAWRLLPLPGAPPVTHFALAMLSRTVTVRIDKAREELGYTPRWDLEQGLEAMRHAAAS